MKRIICTLLVLFLASLVQAAPLKVSTGNTRYLIDPATGRAVILSGSHTWQNFQTYATFDWPTYLNFLVTNGHNFARLWRWEQPMGTQNIPQPWTRTGPGNANDGLLKYDLTSFDQSFFDRLRQKTIEAGNRGIYVSIMLFEGFALRNWRSSSDGFPYTAANNINSIDDGYTSGTDFHVAHEGTVAAITTKQKAYVHKVVDTVNDLDNVIYEIGNELVRSTNGNSWRADILSDLITYEAGKAKQHPIWYTAPQWASCTDANSNDILFASSAQAVAPADCYAQSGGSNATWGTDPPVNTGSKVVLIDSDHIAYDARTGYATSLADTSNKPTQTWPWKVFVRGHSPVYMDNWGDYTGTVGDGAYGDQTQIRTNIGYIENFAKSIRLENLVPSNSISTTTYALYNSGDEYLVYQPVAGNITVDMIAGTFFYEYFRPSTGAITSSGTVTATTGLNAFIPAYYPVVLHLKKPPRTMQ